MENLVQERGDAVVISPQGDLHRETAEGFQILTDELLGAGRQYFVVDLGEASFVDSAGLGALVRLYKRVRIGEGDVRLARVSPNVMQILELTRLNRVFDIFASPQEAAASIKLQN
jgi:anti-sigma B factor antagonist